MTDLKVYDATKTKMNGIVPSSIYSLTNLIRLDLSAANFTGGIGEGISQFNKTLQILYLNNNKFTGPIPSGIGALTVLQEIKLQNTDLTGSIPESLCGRRGYGAGEIRVLEVDCAVVMSCLNDNEECGN
jgi:hypothetical protein